MSSCYTITQATKAEPTTAPVPSRENARRVAQASAVDVGRMIRLALYAIAGLGAAALLFLQIRDALGETLPSVLMMLMIGLGFVALTQAGEGRHV